MAYDVSALTDYTAENFEDLITKSLFDAKTMILIKNEGNVKTGIKSSEKIELFETDAIFQTGGTCGFTSSGTTSFTDRDLNVGKIKINEDLCPKTLESKATQKKLQKGSKYESIPFEQQYTEQKAGKIAEQLEKGIWQGDTASGDVNLNKFDGLIKLLDAAGVYVNANATPWVAAAIAAATGITAANVISIVNAMWSALPAHMQGKEDIRIFCGWDTFNKYILAGTNANLFHFSPGGSEVASGEITIFGTNYKLTAVHGLDGTNRLFSIRMSNLFLGTDLENEEEKFEMWYSKDQDTVKFAVEFKEGVNVALPDEVVSFKLTA